MKASNNKVKKFVKDNNLHLLNMAVTANGDTMIYYRAYGSFATDVKIKVFHSR